MEMALAQDISLTIESAFAALTVREYIGVFFPRRPRRALDRLFAAGRVRSAGKPVAAKRCVGELGDLVVVGGLDDLPEILIHREDRGLKILHEDERLVVLDKASGIPVLPDLHGGSESCLGYLVSRELRARREKPPSEYYRPRIVHRIDRLTSGLVIVARTPEAERELGEYFAVATIRKEYLALLSGVVEPARLTVDCPVAPGRKGRMRAAPGGKPALTEFDVLERFAGHTLCLVRPRSGRTHQIRVHAHAVGHPVACDTLYSSRDHSRAASGIGRLALHAWRYSLPATWPGSRTFTCPLADDLGRVFEEIRS